MINKAKVSVFVGHFGSGKTEMSINFALKAAEQGEHTTLIDLDIVNPFFRSSEVKTLLDEKRIQLIAPNFARTTVDVPSLPPDIQGVFSKKEGVVVFDVGGDPDGARALSIYKPYFDQADFDMYFVINTRRPFTAGVEDILVLMGEIERYSRQKITHLVSNTNLSYETTIEIIEEGIAVVEEVGRRCQLPIAYINVAKSLEDQLPKAYDSKKFILDIYMTQWRN